MSHCKRYIALDLGGSARCVMGAFDGEMLSLQVTERFTNPSVRVLDWVYWDVLGLFARVKDSLQRVVSEYGVEDLASLGVDAMGGACAYLDASGALLGNPSFSRLPQHNADILTEVFSRISPHTIYQQTGLLPTKLRVLYELLAIRSVDSRRFDTISTLLMFPDLINYWLTGRQASEYTIASTSHLIDVCTRNWAFDLFETMALPTHILPEIVMPGQVWAPLHPSIIADTALPAIPVMATAGHDTAAAIAAIPVTEANWAYLSSGTWGMVGVERKDPIRTNRAQTYGFANEGGVNGTIRFIHNSLNLWLVQACRWAWVRDEADYSWDELEEMASQSQPFLAVFDPDAEMFLRPASMPQTIQVFCHQTGQSVPQTPGQIVRVILESLAFSYRQAIDNLSEVQGFRPDVLHLVGGGGRNGLLNQFVANATGLPTIVGPYEATSAGNILMQMIALGDVRDLVEGRELIKRSFGTETYTPDAEAAWEDIYHRTFARIST